MCLLDILRRNIGVETDIWHVNGQSGHSNMSKEDRYAMWQFANSVRPVANERFAPPHLSRALYSKMRCKLLKTKEKESSNV